MESDEMARISTARPMWSCINSLGAVWTQPLTAGGTGCWEMTGHRIYLTVVQRSNQLLSALFASPLLRIPFLGTRDQALKQLIWNTQCLRNRGVFVLHDCCYSPCLEVVFAELPVV